jgi:hypothetical protein
MWNTILYNAISPIKGKQKRRIEMKSKIDNKLIDNYVSGKITLDEFKSQSNNVTWERVMVMACQGKIKLS